MAFLQSLSHAIARDIDSVLSKDLYRYSDDAKDFVAKTLLSAMVARIVDHALNRLDSGVHSIEDVFGLQAPELDLAKKLVQEATQAGFQAAIHQFTGKGMEYYCQINRMPDPPTKTVQ